MEHAYYLYVQPFQQKKAEFSHLVPEKVDKVKIDLQCAGGNEC